MARGKRKKQDQDGLIPSILEPVEDPDFSGGGSSKEFRKTWARLIQKIYEVDSLTCPKCAGKMKTISMIEDEEVIKKILKHLGLWPVESLNVKREKRARPPPKTRAAPTRTDTLIENSFSQLPVSDKWLYAEGHVFSVIDPEYPEGYCA